MLRMWYSPIAIGSSHRTAPSGEMHRMDRVRRTKVFPLASTSNGGLRSSGGDAELQTESVTAHVGVRLGARRTMKPRSRSWYRTSPPKSIVPANIPPNRKPPSGIGLSENAYSDPVVPTMRAPRRFPLSEEIRTSAMSVWPLETTVSDPATTVPRARHSASRFPSRSTTAPWK